MKSWCPHEGAKFQAHPRAVLPKCWMLPGFICLSRSTWHYSKMGLTLETLSVSQILHPSFPLCLSVVRFPFSHTSPLSPGLFQPSLTSDSEFVAFKFTPSKANGTFSHSNSSMTAGLNKAVIVPRITAQCVIVERWSSWKSYSLSQTLQKKTKSCFFFTIITDNSHKYVPVSCLVIQIKLLKAN